MRTALLLLPLATSLACAGNAAPPPPLEPGQIRGQAWADNWFSMSIDDELIVEDSVSITTERSFNQETFVFEADLPVVASFVLKDFKETDSGLEYIGSNRQQMGDGGFIAQFVDADGEIIGFTSSDWRCLTIHEAPLDKSCEKSEDPESDCTFRAAEEPAGWRAQDFDDSAWPRAQEWSAREVDPKQGYDEIDWNPSAKLIWGDDLEIVNTLLCRATLGG